MKQIFFKSDINNLKISDKDSVEKHKQHNISLKKCELQIKNGLQTLRNMIIDKSEIKKFMNDIEQQILVNHQELSIKLVKKSEDDINKFNKIDEDKEEYKRELKTFKKTNLELINKTENNLNCKIIINLNNINKIENEISKTFEDFKRKSL